MEVCCTNVHRSLANVSQFTSTQSIFVMRCGPIDLTATFLSPVEVINWNMWWNLINRGFQPSDLVNQSIPFSYVSVSATPNDAGSHSVQIYMDITAEWLASDGVSSVNWTTSTGNIITHQVQLQNQSMFTESQNRVLREFKTCSNASVFLFVLQRDRSICLHKALVKIWGY